MRRRFVLAVVLAVFGWIAWLSQAARAEEVVADLSSHIIAINAGFTGSSVVLFGATEGTGDIVVVVRGPERDTTVWRKGKVAGIWVNAEAVTFSNVPSFYSVAANRPLDAILSPAAAALHRIGTEHLQLEVAPGTTPERARRFAQALIDEQQRAGLFSAQVGKVSFLGEPLFRTTLSFPGNVPTGSYLVEIFLVRDHDVVGGQTTPLVVSKVGIDAAVSDFAQHRSAIYGAIAVLVAVVAGWLAALPFRGV